MTVMTQELVDKVVELRRRTEAPAMACRKALYRSEWDLDKAEAYLKSPEGRHYGVSMLITKRYRPDGS